MPGRAALAAFTSRRSKDAPVVTRSSRAASTATSPRSAGHSVAPPRVVVVTGVSRFLGARVAARLAADPRVERVIGLDPHEPPSSLADQLAGVELIRAD